MFFSFFCALKLFIFNGMLLLISQLVEDSMVKLERICREANVMLIFARSYGLTGFIRICVKVVGLKNIIFLAWHFLQFAIWMKMIVAMS